MSFFCCCGGCAVTFTGTTKLCSSLGAGVAGATVVVKDHTTGTVYDTRTTASGGSYSGGFTLASGSSVVVDVVVTLGNGTVTSSSRTFTCGANTVPFVVVPVSTVTVVVTGCASGVAGATVAVTLAGVTTTATTDGLGRAAFFLKNGSYTYTVTGAFRYANASGSFTASTGTCTQSVPVTLAAAAGFVCWCDGVLNVPVKTSLTGTGLSASGVALTYSFTYSGSDWVSSVVPVTVPGGACCSVTAVTVDTQIKLCAHTLIYENNAPCGSAYCCPVPGAGLSSAHGGPISQTSASPAPGFLATFDVPTGFLLSNCIGADQTLTVQE